MMSVGWSLWARALVLAAGLGLGLLSLLLLPFGSDDTPATNEQTAPDAQSLSRFEAGQAQSKGRGDTIIPPPPQLAPYADPRNTALTATICAWGPCVLVQAGGLNFLVGAARGSADFLQTRGLSGSPETPLDAIFLTRLSLTETAGLALLRDASWRAGREQALPVWGPVGTQTLIEGLNSFMQAHDAALSVTQTHLSFRAALTRGQDVMPPRSGKPIFDSGLVTITAWPTQPETPLAQLIYRFDTPGKTLIVAGCGAAPDYIARAAKRASEQLALVLSLRSTPLEEASQHDEESSQHDVDAVDCLDLEAAQSLSDDLGLSDILPVPWRTHEPKKLPRWWSLTPDAPGAGDKGLSPRIAPPHTRLIMD